MYVLCCGVMLLFFYCTAHMYSCTVYSSWGAHGSSVREWPPWRSEHSITQNTDTADRSDNGGDLVASSVSIPIILIHLHHHEQRLAACLPRLRYGFKYNMTFICNYFIFPSLYKYWHCSCPQCIIGFPSLSPSSELQLFLSNLTGWQYYIWVSELSLSRLIMENIQLLSQY